MKAAAKRIPRINAHYDSLKEWRADPKGYFLIKIFYDRGEIGVRLMTYRHKPVLDVYGTDGYAIVQTLVRERLLSRLQHAAYLGYELHRAEMALKLRLVYVQDKPLDFSRKATEPESSNSD